MDNKKLTKLEHLRKVIYFYQEDYEIDRENIWVKDFMEHSNKIENLLNQLREEIDERAYSAQYLGFVQGMNYALDLMNISGKGENKEILERFLRDIEYLDENINSENGGTK
ncbi:MAG: hypothetical protein NC093_07315 [Alistipes sp.]|nr:hypothetical protein [Alistipes sp.]